MLKYMENLKEVRILRKNVCYTKNSVTYSKWAFPTAQGGWNQTYAEKVNQTILKEIFKETENYKTILTSSDGNLEQKYPKYLKRTEKDIVYGLEQNKPFATKNSLTMQIIKSKADLILWGRLASKVYKKYDTDFIYESFKTDLRKSYADYFIYYQNKKPVGIAQVIRGGGYSAIYWVGVLEEYRKKGFGAELTKQTLNYEIAHKHYKFLLTASELGLKIYKKLGFKPMETFYEYDLKR